MNDPMTPADSTDRRPNVSGDPVREIRARLDIAALRAHIETGGLFKRAESLALLAEVERLRGEVKGWESLADPLGNAPHYRSQLESEEQFHADTLDVLHAARAKAATLTAAVERVRAINTGDNRRLYGNDFEAGMAKALWLVKEALADVPETTECLDCGRMDGGCDRVVEVASQGFGHSDDGLREAIERLRRTPENEPDRLRDEVRGWNWSLDAVLAVLAGREVGK